MIVDAHTHLGYDPVFEQDFTRERLVTNMERNGIDVSIVQPGTAFDLKTVMKYHNAIFALSKKMPGKIYGLANPNPHLPSEEYNKELKRCVKDLGFVAVKIHPVAHAVNPSQSDGRKVFQTASDLGITIMVHTGANLWSLPSLLIPLAMEFPRLNVILAHSGSAMFVHEAVLAAKLCPNVFLEASWLQAPLLQRTCKTLGADRVMFGSDHGENAENEISKFKSIDLTDDELEWCLGKTAIKVFKIKI